MQRRQSAGVISSTPPVGPAMPALLMRASRPPHSLATVLNIASTSASTDTSALQAMRFVKARFASAIALSEISQIATRAPSAESVLAMAKPIPAAPAVINTRWPSMPARKSEADFGALLLMIFSLGTSIAQRDHGAQHHEPEQDGACRIGQCRAGKECLQSGQKQDAAQHAEIVAASAG